MGTSRIRVRWGRIGALAAAGVVAVSIALVTLGMLNMAAGPDPATPINITERGGEG